MKTLYVDFGNGEYWRGTGSTSWSNTVQQKNDLTPVPGKQLYSLWMKCDTIEEAEEVKAKFPKYCNVRVNNLIDTDYSKKFAVHFPIVAANLSASKTAGEKNETGIKRTNKILEILKQEYKH